MVTECKRVCTGMLAGLLALSCMNKVDTSEAIPSEQDWHIVNSTVSLRGEREEILYPDNTAFTVRKDGPETLSLDIQYEWTKFRLKLRAGHIPYTVQDGSLVLQEGIRATEVDMDGEVSTLDWNWSGELPSIGKAKAGKQPCLLSILGFIPEESVQLDIMALMDRSQDYEYGSMGEKPVPQPRRYERIRNDLDGAVTLTMKDGSGAEKVLPLDAGAEVLLLLKELDGAVGLSSCTSLDVSLPDGTVLKEVDIRDLPFKRETVRYDMVTGGVWIGYTIEEFTYSLSDVINEAEK